MTDLTELAEKEHWKDIIRPAKLLDACTYEGHVYCVPLNIHSWQWMWVNRHVFESLAMNARIALHVRTLYGRDPHHITEAQYKAVARALRQAVEYDPRVSGVPSTKGTL